MNRPNNLKVGQLFLVVAASGTGGKYNNGDILTLSEDDGSSAPYFTTPSGQRACTAFSELEPFEFTIGSRVVTTEDLDYGDVPVGSLAYLVETEPDSDGDVMVRLKDSTGRYYITAGAYRLATDAEWAAGVADDDVPTPKLAVGDEVSFMSNVRNVSAIPLAGVPLTVVDSDPDSDGEVYVRDNATDNCWFVDPRNLVPYVWAPKVGELVVVTDRAYGSAIEPYSVAKVVEVREGGDVRVRGLWNRGDKLVTQRVRQDCVRRLMSEEAELFQK